MLRKNYVIGLCMAGLAILLASCSSYKNPTTTAPVTGLKKRVLLSNSVSLAANSTAPITMIDALKDVFSTKTVGATAPTKMVTAGGMTAILQSAAIQVLFFNNATEVATPSGDLLGFPVDIAISSDGKTGYAAIRTSGSVEAFSTANGNFVANIAVPGVTRLVEGTNGHKLLAFSDNPLGGNTFFVIDTATNTAAAVTGLPLDQPFTAVFDPSDSNDTTAFILNCGAGCGGTAASVVRVNFSTPATPAFGTSVPVFAATVGLLSGSNLFVAGTPATPVVGCLLPACGTLQVINTGSLTAGPAIPITDGLHQQMAMTTNNRVYVGASSCTAGSISPLNTIRGCLSIYNTGAAVSGSNPVFPVESSFRQNFNVTGFQPISSRSVIYVVQGGELDIFDINTDAPSTSINQVDIVGKAFGVVQIDP